MVNDWDVWLENTEFGLVVNDWTIIKTFWSQLVKIIILFINNEYYVKNLRGGICETLTHLKDYFFIKTFK